MFRGQGWFAGGVVWWFAPRANHFRTNAFFSQECRLCVMSKLVFAQAGYAEAEQAAGYEIDRGQLGYWAHRRVGAEHFEVWSEVSRVIGSIGAGCEEGRGGRCAVVAIDSGVERQAELRGKSLGLGEVVLAGEELGDDLILGVGGEGQGRGEVGVGEGVAVSTSADGGDVDLCAGQGLLGGDVEERDDVGGVESVVDVAECGDGDGSVAGGEVEAELGGVAVIGAEVCRGEAEGGDGVGVGRDGGQNGKETGRGDG
jgi:hypothetical protein